MFHIATANLHCAHIRHDSTLPKQLPHHFTEGNTVLIKNHTAGPFDPKYIGDYHIVSFYSNQIELIRSTGGKSKMEHISNNKYMSHTPGSRGGTHGAVANTPPTWRPGC